MSLTDFLKKTLNEGEPASATDTEQQAVERGDIDDLKKKIKEGVKHTLTKLGFFSGSEAGSQTSLTKLFTFPTSVYRLVDVIHHVRTGAQGNLGNSAKERAAGLGNYHPFKINEVLKPSKKKGYQTNPDLIKKVYLDVSDKTGRPGQGHLRKEVVGKGGKVKIVREKKNTPIPVPGSFQAKQVGYNSPKYNKALRKGTLKAVDMIDPHKLDFVDLRTKEDPAVTKDIGRWSLNATGKEKFPTLTYAFGAETHPSYFDWAWQPKEGDRERYGRPEKAYKIPDEEERRRIIDGLISYYNEYVKIKKEGKEGEIVLPKTIQDAYGVKTLGELAMDERFLRDYDNDFEGLPNKEEMDQFALDNYNAIERIQRHGIGERNTETDKKVNELLEKFRNDKTMKDFSYKKLLTGLAQVSSRENSEAYQDIFNKITDYCSKNNINLATTKLFLVTAIAYMPSYKDRAQERGYGASSYSVINTLQLQKLKKSLEENKEENETPTDAFIRNIESIPSVVKEDLVSHFIENEQLTRGFEKYKLNQKALLSLSFIGKLEAQIKAQDSLIAKVKKELPTIFKYIQESDDVSLDNFLMEMGVIITPQDQAILALITYGEIYKLTHRYFEKISFNVESKHLKFSAYEGKPLPPDNHIVKDFAGKLVSWLKTVKFGQRHAKEKEMRQDIEYLELGKRRTQATDVNIEKYGYIRLPVDIGDKQGFWKDHLRRMFDRYQKEMDKPKAEQRFSATVDVNLDRWIRARITAAVKEFGKSSKLSPSEIVIEQISEMKNATVYEKNKSKFGGVPYEKYISVLDNYLATFRQKIANKAKSKESGYNIYEYLNMEGDKFREEVNNFLHGIGSYLTDEIKATLYRQSQEEKRKANPQAIAMESAEEGSLLSFLDRV